MEDDILNLIASELESESIHWPLRSQIMDVYPTKELLVYIMGYYVELNSFQKSYLLMLYSHYLQSFDNHSLHIEFRDIYLAFLKNFDRSELTENQVISAVFNAVGTISSADILKDRDILNECCKIYLQNRISSASTQRKLEELIQYSFGLLPNALFEKFTTEHIYARALCLSPNVYPMVCNPIHELSWYLDSDSLLCSKSPEVLELELKHLFSILHRIQPNIVKLKEPEFIHRILFLFDVSPDIFTLAFGVLQKFILCLDEVTFLAVINDLTGSPQFSILAVKLMKHYVHDCKLRGEVDTFPKILPVLLNHLLDYNGPLYTKTGGKANVETMIHNLDTLGTVLAFLAYLKLSRIAKDDFSGFAEFMLQEIPRVMHELENDTITRKEILEDASPEVSFC
jgi:hypothetical protein